MASYDGKRIGSSRLGFYPGLSVCEATQNQHFIATFNFPLSSAVDYPQEQTQHFLPKFFWGNFGNRTSAAGS